LKKVYAVIRAIQAVSGWTWDDETGASIDYTTADSWDAYVAQHKDAKPFQNANWIHLEKISQIMPSTTHGINVFWASDASTGMGGAAGVGIKNSTGEPPHASPSALHGSPEKGLSDDKDEQVHFNHFLAVFKY
jgi:hypothetical protein